MPLISAAATTDPTHKEEKFTARCRIRGLPRAPAMPGDDEDAVGAHSKGPLDIVAQLREAALGLCTSLKAHQEKRRDRLQTLRTQSGMGRSRRQFAAMQSAEPRCSTTTSGPRPLFCSITMSATNGVKPAFWSLVVVSILPGAALIALNRFEQVMAVRASVAGDAHECVPALASPGTRLFATVGEGYCLTACNAASDDARCRRHAMCRDHSPSQAL